ncbi:D-2-hydroxyacid dehydrogenase family protein [Bacteriovorax sp. PP10]|uniref:D-2-hydroxyacid dehydrogenase family protein n=1 Tax=Bacteriovorax antarcticus TaxID=3088717 RepID=A0ABU5VSJ6_9BACT|nr:D-2-hydroxyacid dehydrogenase family protein [Bacteriovorax sp. PP10]MEA9356028.1 D-2-hydroxyacid dehydrogenase family protein [Bacteriovorax sp. PP10]
MSKQKIAILDDYQNKALELADWSEVQKKAEVTVFNDHLPDPQAVIKRLLPFDIICVMRERTPMTAAILEALPNLKLIVSTGSRNASIDVEACEKKKIKILHTNYFATPTIELTWALILSIAKNITSENASLRTNGWQKKIGADLHGKTLAVLGLGNIGSQIAIIAKAFGMNVISWSQNLTAEKAQEAGTTLVTKEELFKQADFLTVHLVLSPRSKGLVGKNELALMKPTAFLINTSRGPIIEEAALIEALEKSLIAGAAIDVYDQEPLQKDHPFRSLENVLATPHIGYVSQGLYETFYKDSVKNILTWLNQ